MILVHVFILCIVSIWVSIRPPKCCISYGILYIIVIWNETLINNIHTYDNTNY